MEEVNYQLELKGKEIHIAQEALEVNRRKAQQLGWKLRDKAEKLKRIRNETDLVKKLLQGELAMVKHEFE